jgi:hypothetical protein
MVKQKSLPSLEGLADFKEVQCKLLYGKSSGKTGFPVFALDLPEFSPLTWGRVFFLP